MLRFPKLGMVILTASISSAPPLALAQKSDDSNSTEASDASTPHDRTFEETREFMKKHSEESKRTGKM